jgi:hypothetical protein
VPLSFAPGEAYQFDWSHEAAKWRRNVSNKVRQSCVASPRYFSNGRMLVANTGRAGVPVSVGTWTLPARPAAQVTPTCRSLHSFLGCCVAFMVILLSLAMFPDGGRIGRCISPDWQSFGFHYAVAVELQLSESHPPAIDFRIPLSTGPKVCVGSRSAYPRDDSRCAFSHFRLRAAPGVVSRPIAVWLAGSGGRSWLALRPRA